jgi:hypothetical protein
MWGKWEVNLYVFLRAIGVYTSECREELLQSHMLCARRGFGIGLVTNGLEDHITFVILLKWVIIYEIIFKHFKS